MAIDVGDAVLKFIGDTSAMDRAFASVGPKAKAAFDPASDAIEKVGDSANAAADEVEDLGNRAQSSMREARGEVALIGEEIGVHLPRHVQTFVAQLPGVGEALTAAFSATAVLFLIQAVAQGAEKFSAWVGANLIFNQAMKDSDAEIAKEATTLNNLAKQYAAAQAKLDELKGATVEETAAMKESTKATLAEAEAQLTGMKAKIAGRSWWENTKIGITDVVNLTLNQLIPGYSATTQAVDDLIAVHEKEQFVAIASAKAKAALAKEDEVQAEENRQKAIKNQMEELENEKKVALASATIEEDKYNLTQYYENKKLELLKSLGNKEKEQAEQLLAEITAQQIEHAQKLEDALIKPLIAVRAFFDNVSVASQRGIKSMTDFGVSLDPAVVAMNKLREATSALGITTREDLVANLNKAQAALIAYAQSGLQDIVVLKAIEAQIKQNQKALDAYGKTEDQDLKIKSHGLWAQMNADTKTGAQAMQGWKQLGTNAMDSVAASAQSAITNLILAQGSFGAAMKKATEQVLASLASQALVTGLFDEAKSYAAAAAFDYSGAAQYQAAADTMFIVAGLAGGAAAGMSRIGGSGSNNNSQNPEGLSGGSNTSGSGIRGGTSVRGFADGGLIMSPTLAVMGEGYRKEAVLPLEDPQAMKQIGDAIGGNSNAGNHVHFHLPHGSIISADVMQKFVSKMNKMVARGQVNVKSSSSLKLTKRGG